jgi:hypothetical protein
MLPTLFVSALAVASSVQAAPFFANKETIQQAVQKRAEETSSSPREVVKEIQIQCVVFLRRLRVAEVADHFPFSTLSNLPPASVTSESCSPAQTRYLRNGLNESASPSPPFQLVDVLTFSFPLSPSLFPLLPSFLLSIRLPPFTFTVNALAENAFNRIIEQGQTDPLYIKCVLFPLSSSSHRHPVVFCPPSLPLLTPLSATLPLPPRRRYFGNASQATAAGFYASVAWGNKAGTAEGGPVLLRCDNPDGGCDQTTSQG